MTFTVTNTGDAPALNTMVMVDGLPAEGVTYDTRAFDGERIAIECLLPGQSRTVTARYEADEPGELAVTAVAEAYCADRVEKSLRTAVKGISAILIEVVDEDTVQVGNETVYELYVKNQGTAPDLNIDLSATLPAEMSFVRGEGDSEVTADGKNVKFGRVDELAPGGVVGWKLYAKADAAGKVKLRVELKSDANPEPVIEEEPTTLY